MDVSICLHYVNYKEQTSLGLICVICVICGKTLSDLPATPTTFSSSLPTRCLGVSVAQPVHKFSAPLRKLFARHFAPHSPTTPPYSLLYTNPNIFSIFLLTRSARVGAYSDTPTRRCSPTPFSPVFSLFSLRAFAPSRLQNVAAPRHHPCQKRHPAPEIAKRTKPKSTSPPVPPPKNAARPR